MKTGKIIKRALAVALAVVLILPVTGGTDAQAKSVITISTNRVQLTKAGETATVTINGLTAKQKKRYIWILRISVHTGMTKIV